MEKVIVCRFCGQPAALIHQRSTHPTQPASVQATCWTRMCKSFGRTLDTRDTAQFAELFTFQEDDSAADEDWTLDLLQWRIESLQRLERLGS